ncbi:retrovirus-related Pol polyprotein from transposon opus [Trichonephila clavipes]|nr:retrovirus-related Pol polyprotein from transposon opus [Trichonephila clavipes]
MLKYGCGQALKESDSDIQYRPIPKYPVQDQFAVLVQLLSILSPRCLQTQIRPLWSCRHMRDFSINTKSFHSATLILLSSNYWWQRRLWFCVKGRPSNRRLVGRPRCCKRRRMLKEALTSSPILIYPQPDKPFILDTDVSNESVGAVLSQEIDGQERVVAYWSKCLSKPERNYCVTRKELLAIVKAIEHFHHYLYGQKFLLRTDHASLTWLMNFRNTEGQVARLNEYYFDIRHRKGSSHGNADALSRRPCPENCRHCSRVETKYDYAIRQITTSTATPPDPRVMRKFEKTRWRILILNPL